MLPLLLLLYVGRLGEAAAPLMPRIEGEIANHLAFVDGALAGRGFLVGEALTGADIQMSFIPQVARAFGQLAPYPNLTDWIGRLQARPAYRRALERGGPYSLAA
jgi:glutathione S-transferase